jgi:hypothetical protein
MPEECLTTRWRAARTSPAADLNEYIEDISKGEIREKLTEWLPFFRNKYPQIGVVAGNFFDSHGNPTPLFLEYTSLISPKPAPPVVMEDCVFHGKNQVKCESKFLSTKIKKSRGKGTCVCVNENEIFSQFVKAVKLKKVVDPTYRGYIQRGNKGEVNGMAAVFPK